MARGRAWRRAKDATKELKRERLDRLRAERRPDADSFGTSWPATKRWKEMYTRSEKIARGRQLGFEYPRRTQRELLDEHTDLPDADS